MADLLFIAARADIERAETLAGMFMAADLSVESPRDDALEECGAAVIVLSRHAMRCRAFRDVAEEAIESGKAIVASLMAPPQNIAEAAPAFDLSAWRGEAEAPILDDFFCAAYSRALEARRARAAQAPEAPEEPETPDEVMAPANDNPAETWEEDSTSPKEEDSACALATFRHAAAWSADLPDRPLPVPQTRAAARRKRGRRLDAAARAAGILLLIGAALYGEAYQRSEMQSAERSNFAQVSVTEFEAPAPEPIESGVEPPRWLREPASAPRS